MKPKVDKPTNCLALKRTGKRVKFTDVGIGAPFFAHRKIWVRTSYDAATVLSDSVSFASTCNFMIDACDRNVDEVVISGPCAAEAKA